MRAAARPAAALPLVAAALLFAGACASTPKPDWVGGESAQYSAQRWVIGIESDTDADRAEALAIASIARQIGGDASQARLVDSWHDDGTHTSWALAVLDRAALIEQLVSDLSEVNAQILAALRTAGREAPAQTLSALAAAVGLLPERDRLRERITMVGGKPPQDASAADRRAREVEAALAAAKRKLRIEVSSWDMDPKTGDAGEPRDENRRALVQKVLDLGFTPDFEDTAWGVDPIWLRVECKVGLERLHLHPDDTMVAVHWDAALEITDVAGGGDVVALMSEQGRSVHLSELEARRRADEEATRFAAGALEAWLHQRIGTNRDEQEENDHE